MEKVKVLKLSEITENTSKLVEIEDKKIAVFNVDGEIYAIDDTCSHAEASLSEGERDSIGDCDGEFVQRFIAFSGICGCGVGPVGGSANSVGS